MRVTNGLFGLRFNKKLRRTGKVANERPKTPLIGDSESQMRVHFYIEANPIRANITTLEKLRFFKWSSYRFYAYGIIDGFTRSLTPPQWYIELGKSDNDRQVRYRKLFRNYVQTKIGDPKLFFMKFIGAPAWIALEESRLKVLQREFALRLQQALDFGDPDISQTAPPQ